MTEVRKEHRAAPNVRDYPWMNYILKVDATEGKQSKVVVKELANAHVAEHCIGSCPSCEGLRRHVALNHLDGIVTVVPVAISDGTAPRLHGYQAEGAAPLVQGAPVEHPETVASAIRIGNPARWEEAMDAMSSSGGSVRAVTDEQILDAYRFLAAHEGVFCEPASAAGVAGLLKHGAEGAEKIACVLTGHGLKDPQTALAVALLAAPSGRYNTLVEFPSSKPVYYKQKLVPFSEYLPGEPFRLVFRARSTSICKVSLPPVRTYCE